MGSDLGFGRPAMEVADHSKEAVVLVVGQAIYADGVPFVQEGAKLPLLCGMSWKCSGRR
jgi:hypothetical protein